MPEAMREVKLNLKFENQEDADEYDKELQMASEAGEEELFIADFIENGTAYVTVVR